MHTKVSQLKRFKESMPAWRSASTLYRYPRLVATFIDYVGVKPTYDKVDAMRFLNHIINSGLSKNYAQWSAYILKQFYESLGLTFPLKARDLPQVGPGDINAPVFAAAYVESLVKAVKRKGDPRMRAYLALSTAFGLRREELALLSSKNIDNGVVTFQAIKHGEIRQLTMPQEIQPYILGYELAPAHPQTATNVLKKIQLLAGYKHEERDGWHSIRRGLITGLVSAGVPISHVYSFMGWKLSRRLGIVGVYTRPDFKDVEEAVYAKHPFTPFWR